MIINPITQPDDFHCEIQVLSAYVRELAVLARKSRLDRSALQHKYSACMAFLGVDYSGGPSTGVSDVDTVKQLVSVVHSLAFNICKAHIAALGDFNVPFSTNDFLKEHLKSSDHFLCSGGGGIDAALDHFERFCFEEAFYREMKTMYTPDAGRDMAYRVAADGLAECLPWFSMVQKRKGYLVFEKRSISEPQYGSSPCSLRFPHGLTSDFRELVQHLKSFTEFSSNPDFQELSERFLARLYRMSNGFELRDTEEYGDVRLTFFKSKIEIRLTDVLASQLIAFVRCFACEHKLKNRIEPNLERLQA
jgi:hypothetical protein